MSASRGISRYRQIVAKRKAKPIFLRPLDFLDACVGYFEWAEDYPLLEEKAFHHQGVTFREDVAKVRMFSKKALASHIGIPVSRLEEYKKLNKDWKEAVEMVEDIIYTQKMENAAAGLLNSAIMTRELGLTDKQEIEAETTVSGGGPIEIKIQPVAKGSYLPPIE